MIVASARVVHPATGLEHDKICFHPLRNRNHTERPSTCAVRALANHLIHAVLLGIDLARETVAPVAFTRYFHAPGGHVVAEGGCGFQIDRVPGKLDEGIPVGVSIGARNERGTVSDRLVFRTPDAGLVGADARWVDVVATKEFH